MQNVQGKINIMSLRTKLFNIISWGLFKKTIELKDINTEEKKKKGLYEHYKFEAPAKVK